MEIEIWCLFEIWVLGFGVFILPQRLHPSAGFTMDLHWHGSLFLSTTVGQRSRFIQANVARARAQAQHRTAPVDFAPQIAGLLFP